MAKLNRERRLVERRLLKQAKRRARKEEALAPPEPVAEEALAPPEAVAEEALQEDDELLASRPESATP